MYPYSSVLFWGGNVQERSILLSPLLGWGRAGAFQKHHDHKLIFGWFAYLAFDPGQPSRYHHLNLHIKPGNWQSLHGQYRRG